VRLATATDAIGLGMVHQEATEEEQPGKPTDKAYDVQRLGKE
jgi:hypothetical protein